MVIIYKPPPVLLVIYAEGKTIGEAFSSFENKLNIDLQSVNFSVAKCESNKNIDFPFITIDAYRAHDQKLLQGILKIQSAQENGNFYLRMKFEIP